MPCASYQAKRSHKRNPIVYTSRGFTLLKPTSWAPSCSYRSSSYAKLSDPCWLMVNITWKIFPYTSKWQTALHTVWLKMKGRNSQLQHVHTTAGRISLFCCACLPVRNPAVKTSVHVSESMYAYHSVYICMCCVGIHIYTCILHVYRDERVFRILGI